jgi:hypothetical protein
VPPTFTGTTLRPSIIAIFARSGSNGALQTGKREVGRGRRGPPALHCGNWAPNGFWITRNRSGAGAPSARASVSRSRGSRTVAEPPQAHKNDRRAIL